MNEIAFFVDGIPVGQPRVKAARRGSFIHMYTPDTADAWKRSIMLEASSRASKSLRDAIEADGAFVRLRFWMPRPKAHFLHGKVRVTSPFWHTKKPDNDNLQKAVLDALTDAQLWKDDASVCTVISVKGYCYLGQKSGCYITVTAAQSLAPPIDNWASYMQFALPSNVPKVTIS